MSAPSIISAVQKLWTLLTYQERRQWAAIVGFALCTSLLEVVTASMIIIFAQGKVHTIPHITYVRQKGSSQAAASQKDWMDRLFYTDWLSDLKKAIYHVAEFIALQTKGEPDKYYKRIYDSFVTKHKTRYIPNQFYVLKNIDFFLNKDNLTNIILSKAFRLFPQQTERASLNLLKRYCPSQELENILASISHNDSLL